MMQAGKTDDQPNQTMAAKLVMSPVSKKLDVGETISKSLGTCRPCDLERGLGLGGILGFQQAGTRVRDREGEIISGRRM